jgi:hypothetical protein
VTIVFYFVHAGMAKFLPGFALFLRGGDRNAVPVINFSAQEASLNDLQAQRALGNRGWRSTA